MIASSRVGKATPIASSSRNASNLTRDGSATSLIACSQSLTAPSSISLAVNAIQAVTLPTQLARLLGHVLRAGPLPPILNRDLRADCALWIRWAVSIASRLIGFDGIGSMVPISLASSPPNPIATPPPCNRAGPVRSLRSLRPSKKRNSTSCLIGTLAGLLPWLRLRTVFRHPCLQTRGRGIVAAKDP